MQEQWDLVNTIPYDDISKAFHALPYGSTSRVMLGVAFATGCRLKELEYMRVQDLQGTVLWWKLGKNQRTWRRENIGAALTAELEHYRRTHRVKAGQLFGRNSESFRRMFNRFIRPKLGGLWMAQEPAQYRNISRLNYIYGLKALRKGFVTLVFAREYKKWGDAYMSMQIASKRMKHRSTKVTAYHYAQALDKLQALKYAHLEPYQLLEQGYSQSKLTQPWKASTGSGQATMLNWVTEKNPSSLVCIPV